MNNIQKINVDELPPLFGNATRPAQRYSGADAIKANVKDMGLNFDSYTLQKGDIFRFPSFDDMSIEVQPIREPLKDEDVARIPKVAYVIGELERNGKKRLTRFNVNSLSKRDVNNVPVMPYWYELGSLTARLEELAKVGAVTVKETVSIEVPVFEGNQRKTKEVLREDGTVDQVYDNKTQEVSIVVPLEQ